MRIKKIMEALQKKRQWHSDIVGRYRKCGMNAENIAKALKCCYPLDEISSCAGCPYDGKEPDCIERDIEYHAGEIIESLLIQQETLQKALAESQRREQVLWENLEDAVSKNAGCVLCVHEFGWRGPVEGELHETL